MRRSVVSLASILILAVSFAFFTPLAMAGWKNQNDENGKSYERGTGAVHGPQGNPVDGCRAEGGNIAVFIPPAGVAWWGGACCASNKVAGATLGGTTTYWPNLCCNPPDFEATQPGNHCLCFEIRGYTEVP